MLDIADRELAEKYAEHGATQFIVPDVLKAPPSAGPRGCARR